MAPGYLIQQDAFYQKDVSAQVIPHLNVSCVFGQSYTVDANPQEVDRIWSNTDTRLLAGDQIVMWSEESMMLSSDEQEEGLIARAKHSIKANSDGNAFLAISYLKRLKHQVNCTNMMVLIAPGGQEAWRYQKSHPVPVVEFYVEPGPDVVPIFDTDKLIAGRTVRLGGSICFGTWWWRCRILLCCACCVVVWYLG